MMKMIVSELPSYSEDCLFIDYDINYYSICKFDRESCTNPKKCPYLKVQSENRVIQSVTEIVGC